MYNQASGLFLENKMLNVILKAAFVGLVVYLDQPAYAHGDHMKNWLAESVDKTIVVTKHGNYTIPAPRNSGTGVIHEYQRDHHNKSYIDYGRHYRNDSCAQSGRYEECGNKYERALKRP